MFRRKKKEYTHCLTFASLVSGKYVLFDRYITLNDKSLDVKRFTTIVDAIKEKEGLDNLVLINHLFLGRAK